MTGHDDPIILCDAAGVPSPRRVRICLLEKKLPFISRWQNIGLMDQKRPEYLRLNPTGMVPSIIHDGKVIFDSNVINEYLDAVYPAPRLTPENPFDIARMRMWFAFETDFGRPFREATYETLGKARVQKAGLNAEQLMEQVKQRTVNPAYHKLVASLFSSPTNHEIIADRLQLIFEKLAWLESSLQDGREWLCGKQFTLADIAVAPRLDMFPLIGVDNFKERFPLSGSWLDRVKERPSWHASAFGPKDGELETFTSAD